jgi:hypothetical protein
MKPVTFTLEGDSQVYSLTFDFKALCDTEAVTGCNLLLTIGGLGVTATSTRALLFALLKTAHPAVTLKEAGELLARDPDVVLKHIYDTIPHPEKAAVELPAVEPPVVQVQA